MKAGAQVTEPRRYGKLQKAGPRHEHAQTHDPGPRWEVTWVPAFAGMTLSLWLPMRDKSVLHLFSRRLGGPEFLENSAAHEGGRDRLAIVAQGGNQLRAWDVRLRHQQRAHLRVAVLLD